MLKTALSKNSSQLHIWKRNIQFFHNFSNLHEPKKNHVRVLALNRS